MDNLYKIGGTLQPANSVSGIKFETEYNGLKLKINEGQIEVESLTEEKFIESETLAETFMKMWGFMNDRPISIEWSMKSIPNPSGGRIINVSIHEKITLTDSISATVTRTINGVARIISEAKDGSFKNISEISDKSLKDQTLQMALAFYMDEVVSDERPLIGVYKAIEIIANHLGKGELEKGYATLAGLVGEPKKFVKDLQETTQSQRHALTKARKHFDDQEAKRRAKLLVLGYMNSL